ncbi:nitrous oxide reductase family maturation protein NosD [Fulvivirgaceae bacterium BMA10]|uniref:Nitrous oxide reductase family maturation protein NosD n=1 Tax=Splendidivirga corallicola TaxID=3051826 RepID=A0ABT8KYM7_9BACT|nr:nitrous oxide reductase family maturation protein NosD [Fulvivirgaceae bacterium BMA10]
MTRYMSILLIGCFVLSAPLSMADTLTICQTCPVKTIKQGLDKSKDGDVVIVKPGFYQEGNLNITKQITFLGEDFPVIDGNNNNEVLTINADSVVVRGFLIQNVGTNYLEDRAGININERDYCIIENNKLINTFFGIYLKNVSDCIVRDNLIQGKAIEEISSGNAIHAWKSKNLIIENNLAEKHRDGIYLEFVDNSVISGNTSRDNLRYGLHFMFSNHDQYRENIFLNNGAGVAVMFSRNIEMIQNRFEKNWGASSYGLLLKEIYDGKIEHNTFLSNTIGIYAEGANRLNFNYNDFEKNGWALKILGSCMDNKFEYNNFISNTFDLSTNSSRNYNEYIHNYWGDYTGYDLDKDGFGDVPYRPVKLFSYIVSKVDPSIILLRSLFIDILNFAEKVTPVFTPESLKDVEPLMKPVK